MTNDNESTSMMDAIDMEELQAQVKQLLVKVSVSEDRQKTFEEKIEGLNESLSQFQTTQTVTEYKDIVTSILSGDQIQLESYRTIPEFSGNKLQYRSWREQVVRRMTMIEAFKTHPKYEAALGIIRAKVTGVASDILINNKTAYNINAIVDRLDFSYADQRPLYVVEAEMTSIKQSNKTLQEFYDKINQALNLVITKIVMTYKNENEQKSLIEESQQKAVRTFIMGLSNSMTRSTIYGASPRTLTKAFAIAQTIFYDNEFLQLDPHRESQKRNVPHNAALNHSKPQYHPGFNYNKPQNAFQPQFNNKSNEKPEAMEIDSSRRFKQATNFRQLNGEPNAQKREHLSSRQHVPQVLQKFQRINQLGENETTEENEEGEYVPDDLISNTSYVSDSASTFLGE